MLRPGGVFVDADHLPDAGLTELLAGRTPVGRSRYATALRGPLR